MSGKKILVVDDDSLLRQSLAYNLKNAGFQAATAPSAETGIAHIETNPPDLVLLDVGLPGMDGMDAVKRIREQWAIPVIFLTGRRKELDEVLGLELGADDYVTKPFDFDVLLARIKAVLRRNRPPAAIHPPQPKILIGSLEIDPSGHTVALDGKSVSLSPREFDLLYLLMKNAGRAVPTEELLLSVWGQGFSGQPQVVYVHIRWLREKIEPDPMNPSRIITVHGIGYKFQNSEA